MAKTADGVEVIEGMMVYKRTSNQDGSILMCEEYQAVMAVSPKEYSDPHVIKWGGFYASKDAATAKPEFRCGQCCGIIWYNKKRPRPFNACGCPRDKTGRRMGSDEAAEAAIEEALVEARKIRDVVNVKMKCRHIGGPQHLNFLCLSPAKFSPTFCKQARGLLCSCKYQESTAMPPAVHETDNEMPHTGDNPNGNYETLEESYQRPRRWYEGFPPL